MLRHVPLRPRPTIGHPLDDPLREAILKRFRARRIETGAIWDIYLNEFGCSEIPHLLHRLAVRYGGEEAKRFGGELVSRLQRIPIGGFPMPPVQRVLNLPAATYKDTIGSWIPEQALFSLSEVEFLTAIEYSLENFGHNVRTVESAAINRLFSNLGAPYRYGFVATEDFEPEALYLPDDPEENPEAYENLGPAGRDEFYRIIDPETENHLIQPALRALADERLAIAARSYQDGLTHMLRLDDKTLKSAVLDFARAVVDAMTTLARATGVNVERNMPVVVLKALTNADVLPSESRSLMLAAASLRNAHEHQNDQARPVKRETAEATMGAASVAITYLATFLPPAVRVEPAAAVPADDHIPF
jgi:hypothetical protein